MGCLGAFGLSDRFSYYLLCVFIVFCKEKGNLMNSGESKLD